MIEKMKLVVEKRKAIAEYVLASHPTLECYNLLIDDWKYAQMIQQKTLSPIFPINDQALLLILKDKKKHMDQFDNLAPYKVEYFLLCKQIEQERLDYKLEPNDQEYLSVLKEYAGDLEKEIQEEIEIGIGVGVSALAHVNKKIKVFHIKQDIMAMQTPKNKVMTEAKANQQIKEKVKFYDQIIDLHLEEKSAIKDILKKHEEVFKKVAQNPDFVPDLEEVDRAEMKLDYVDYKLRLLYLDINIESKRNFRKKWIERKKIK